MAEQRARYWDLEECRWVAYAAAGVAEPAVPAQPQAVDGADVAVAREVDVPSG